MKFLDKAKLKMALGAIEALVPELETKVVEKATFEGHVWFAILLREKEAKKNGSGSTNKH